MSAELVTPDMYAVIWVVPSPTAVTSPEDDTVATLGSELTQATCGLMSAELPSA